jgi:hypothetical protein
MLLWCRAKWYSGPTLIGALREIKTAFSPAHPLFLARVKAYFLFLSPPLSPILPVRLCSHPQNFNRFHRFALLSVCSTPTLLVSRVYHLKNKRTVIAGRVLSGTFSTASPTPYQLLPPLASRDGYNPAWDLNVSPSSFEVASMQCWVERTAVSVAGPGALVSLYLRSAQYAPPFFRMSLRRLRWRRTALAPSAETVSD